MNPKILLAWRIKLGLSRTQAARLLGCSRQAYTRLETGETPIKHYIGRACAAIAQGIPSIEDW